MRKDIQIGPSRYRVAVVDSSHKSMGNDCRGCHYDGTNEIFLLKGMPKDMQAEVLLHEVMHGIFYTFDMLGIDGMKANLEEPVISKMSTGLATIFVQNPWLLDYFKKALVKCS